GQVVRDDDAHAVALRRPDNRAGDHLVVAARGDHLAGADLPFDLITGQPEDLDAVFDGVLERHAALALGQRLGLVAQEVIDALLVRLVHLLGGVSRRGSGLLILRPAGRGYVLRVIARGLDRGGLARLRVADSPAAGAGPAGRRRAAAADKGALQEGPPADGLHLRF